MVVHNTSIFCARRAPCHRLKAVLEYVLKSKMKILDWFANSPDLNPIKNLWSYMKNKVAEKQLFSAKELVTRIKEVWMKKISIENYVSHFIYNNFNHDDIVYFPP